MAASTPRRSTPRRDAMGAGLALLNKLGGSTLIDRLGIRKQTEKVVYEATRTGWRPHPTARRGRSCG